MRLTVSDASWVRILLAKPFFQKLQAVDRNLVAGWLDAAPDRRGARDDFYIGGERFDDNVSFVADRLQRGRDRFPVNVIVARRAAIAAARVEMAEQVPGFADRRP